MCEMMCEMKQIDSIEQVVNSQFVFNELTVNYPIVMEVQNKEKNAQ